MAAEQSTQLLERIRHEKLRSKVMTAEDTVALFENGMYLGFSGFSEGHPKLVPAVLADHVESKGLAGKMRFNVYTGASIGVILGQREDIKISRLCCCDTPFIVV
ncbi:sugar phosphate isomerase family [Geobacter argillaceus]|uniref:Acetyl-CoA hydrolase n=1 Tax=Geobacter argillaceus TaxID=345631 RepID=A0A562V8L5_9BACT|nr:hypothetical protein [Geobacter argillaceus]TWJ14182.1 acetyl-CoA hydrolase [Geobacter argillaceus]